MFFTVLHLNCSVLKVFQIKILVLKYLVFPGNTGNVYCQTVLKMNQNDLEFVFLTVFIYLPCVDLNAVQVNHTLDFGINGRIR